MSRMRPEDAVDTVEKEIHQLQIPTLVIAADSDETIPLWHCQTYTNEISGAELAIIATAKTVRTFLIAETIAITASSFFLLPTSIGLLPSSFCYIPNSTHGLLQTQAQITAKLISKFLDY